MHAGRCAPRWRAAAAILVACVLDASAEDATPLIVSPPGERVELRVGQRRGFSAVLPDPGAEYTWLLDGAPTGKGSQFEFRPTAAFVGTHEVSVTAVAPSLAARHTWVVSVQGVGAPAIVRVVPEATTLRVPAGEPLAFELQAEPAALTDSVTVRWSLDGVMVGEGPRLTVRAPATGAERLRAVATSEFGGAAVREWQIVASADATPQPAPPAAAEPDVPLDPELIEIVRRAKPEQPPPTVIAAVKKKDAAPAATVIQPPREKPAPAPPLEAAPKKPLPPAREKAAPERVAAKPAPTAVAPPPPPPTAPPPLSPPSGVTEDDVRALMFRYEQAWRTRNAAELRRIGHVETDAQEEALTKYFATTKDLEVAVHVLELHTEGGRGVVRFTRRDHFRDPAGREVSQESPPIEKTIVRTPDGVRFAPRS